MLAAPEDFDESFISLSKINNISSSSKLEAVEPETDKLIVNDISSKNEELKDKESSNLKQVFSLYI